MDVGMYVVIGLSVFAVNLLPAFGPPTWAVLLIWYFHDAYSIVALVLVGAVSAASGRLVLAQVSRRLGRHLPPHHRANLEAAGQALLQNRRRTWAGLALFALSPLPSAQLFEAAGLTRVKLLPLTAAFFAGRLVSYAIYLGGAKALGTTDTGQLLMSSLNSPTGILLEVAMLAALVGLTRINWVKRSATQALPS